MPCGTLAHTVLSLHTLAAFSAQEVTCALCREKQRDETDLVYDIGFFFSFTLTCKPVLILFVAFSSRSMTLTPAVASGSVPKIATLADATIGALRVVKALHALAGLPVASADVRHVYVVVALAWLAAPSGLGGVAEVTRGAFLTSGTL